MYKKYLKITPTQELLLEVLAGRYRLGENLWSFNSRFKNNLKRLELLDLVINMDGIIENTVRESLTDKGKEYILSENYTPL